MTSFVDPLIAFVSAHAWLAYLTIFLAALLEAVPMVGSVIPGSTIILALSALVPGGELDLGWRVRRGDRGRGAGRRLGVLDRASLRSAKSSAPGRCRAIRGVVAQSEAFFHRWGTLAVFFARFVPPIRAFVPITAGALGMPPLQLLRGQYRSDPAVGAGAYPARRAGGVRAATELRRHGRTTKASPNITGCRWCSAARLIVALATWIIRRRHGGPRSMRARPSEASRERLLRCKQHPDALG